MPSFDQNSLKQAMLAHYLRQKGGASNFPVFRGSAVQYGQDGRGFADFFRGVARFFLPILQSTASTFVSSAAKGLTEGKTLKDAAKSAVSPTVSSAMGGLSDAAMKKLSGAGRKRRKRKHVGGSKRKKSKRSRKSKNPISILSKIRKVYKGRGKRRKTTRKNSKKNSKHFKSSILNF